MREVIVGSVVGGGVLTLLLFSFSYPEQARKEKTLKSEIAENYLTIHSDCQAAKHWDESVTCEQDGQAE